MKGQSVFKGSQSWRVPCGALWAGAEDATLLALGAGGCTSRGTEPRALSV